MAVIPGRTWRFVLTAPASGARNMAVDEALMERARRTGEWMLRVYGWHPAALSLGRNQTARGAYDMDRLRAYGLDVVRRPTGGRAILHHREVTYSVTGPEDGAGSLREVYEGVNLVLQRGLAALGVHVDIAAHSTPGIAPGLQPCFDRPAGGELTAGGRKLAGSAQWREHGALLQHGSILIDGDQSLVSALLLEPAPAPPQPATLASLLGRSPSISEVGEGLSRALEELTGKAATRMEELERSVEARAAANTIKYQSDEWTWRR
jgi:lipoyl(octanoyl) transferase